MGHLGPIFLALATLLAAEEGFAAEIRAPWAVLVPMSLPYLFSWASRRLVISGRFRAGSFVYDSLTWLPAASFAFVVLVCGWSRWVAAHFGVEAYSIDWPHPTLLLVFAPFVVYTLIVIDARARMGEARSEEIARSRRFQARMFLSTIAPIVLLIVVSWIVGIHPTVRAHVEYVGLWSGLFASLLVLSTMALLPRLLQHVWETSPLPAGSAREVLEGFATRIRFRCRALVLWHTGFQMSNAAVVGIGQGRIVLFTDLLLAQLPDRELIAVFAHEIGHVVRHHVIVFLAWSLALFLGVDWLLLRLEWSDEWSAGAILLGVLIGWYFGFGWYSRRIEVEADLFSVAVTGDREAMIAALRRVAGGHASAVRSWRHFSTDKRIELLRQAELDPSLEVRWTRQLQRIGRIGVVLCALVLAAQAWTLVSAFDEDRVAVELALGRYDQALELARDVEDIEPELAALVARGALLPAESDLEFLLKVAREAQNAQRFEEAFELYGLARLRGARDLDQRIDELRAAVEKAQN